MCEGVCLFIWGYWDLDWYFCLVIGTFPGPNKLLGHVPISHIGEIFQKIFFAPHALICADTKYYGSPNK